MKPKAIDLFSGCGGLTLGLRNAGFRVVAAIDADPLAISTYRQNHRRTRAVLNDIRAVNPKDLMKKLGLKAGQLDLIAGCPPCQGFSNLRTLNGAKRIREPMNDLVFEVLRFVRAFKPRSLMLENVPGLLSNARLAKFNKSLRQLGYQSTAKIFDASEFGVPQRRRRMILIASKGAVPHFALPDEEKVTVRDAIGTLTHPRKSRDPAHNYRVERSAQARARVGAFALYYALY
jgi:DNA (cytosine-5)-methyltransferase 1